MADQQKPPPLLPTGQPPRESTRMAVLSNILAILGFIILALIVVWGIFHIINLSSSSFGSIFSSSPKVQVTAPQTAPAGQPVTISWKYSGTENGSFSFLYQCQQNAQLVTSVSGTLTRIPCGAAITVGSSTSATVVPQLAAGNQTGQIPVTITFVSTDGSKHADGTATISITAPASSATSTMAAKSSTTQPTASTAKPKTPTTSYVTPRYTTSTSRSYVLLPHAAYGPADLSVRLIAVGVIDPYSGALISRAPIAPYETMAIEFDIANIGGSTTGNWYFTAQLPTGPQPYAYTSPAQVPLRPGAHLVNTLRFAPNQRGGIITVTVDPYNQVQDANRGNNTVSQAI